MKLIVILNKYFVIPFGITLFLLIITTIICCIAFIDSYDNKTLQKHMIGIEEKKIIPLIEQVQENFYTKFQFVITALVSLSNSFTVNFNQPNTTTYDTLNSMKNAELIARNYNSIQEHKNENFYNIGTWFISPNLKEYNNSVLPYISTFADLIPYMKSFYFLHKDIPEQTIYYFYLVYKKSELFLSYPILDNQEQFYQKFQIDSVIQKDFCLTLNNSHPSYFYFPCQDWYLQAEQEIEEGKLSEGKIFISYPYKFANQIEGKTGISICYMFTMPFYTHDSSPFFFCADIWIDQFLKKFDKLNKHLNGYFYILLTHSSFPLYYPGLDKMNYFCDLTRMEFPTIKPHTIGEVTYFKETIFPILSNEYNLSQLSTETIGFNDILTEFTFKNSVKRSEINNINYYNKSGSIFKFALFPVFFHIKNDLTHLITLIYVINCTALSNSEETHSVEHKYIIIESSILFFILGITLLSVCKQLIIMFGKNILKSIKTILARLKKDSNAEQIPDIKSISCDSHNNNINNNINNTLSKNTNAQKEEDENIFIDEEEEEMIPIKNKEINSIFDRILSKQKNILFLKNPQATLNTSLLVNFSESKEVFEELNDDFGKNICLSNLGNLSSLSDKYDKAISFLYNSLGLPNEPQIVKLEKNHYKKLDDYLKKQTIAVNKDITQCNNEFKIRTAANFDFSRYMKLFLAYKQFFSKVKQLKRVLNYITTLAQKDSNLYDTIKKTMLYSFDYFLEQRKHRASTLRGIIFSCINTLTDSQETYKVSEKILYCLLELFHLEINILKQELHCSVHKLIELQPKDLNDEELDEESEWEEERNELEIEDIQKELSNKIKDVFYLMEKIEKLRDIVGMFFNAQLNERYKEFLYDIHHLMHKSNSIQLYYPLLNQKFNYLLAKLGKLSGDYSFAIIYYLKVIRESPLISNGIKYKKANMKILGILDFAEAHPDLLNLNEKDRSTVIKLRKLCNDNIDKLNSKSKDLIVIIDETSFGSKKKPWPLQSKIKTLFEKFLSPDDRISLYSFNMENVKKLFPLTKNDLDNYAFINSVFDYLESFEGDKVATNEKVLIDDEMIEMDNINLDKTEEFEEDESVIKVYQARIRMKYPIGAIFGVISDLSENKNSQRELFVIIFTEGFQSEDNEDVNEISINTIFKENMCSAEHVKLIIIGNLKEKQDKLIFVMDKLKSYFQSVDYFEYENYQDIKRLFAKVGDLPREYEFPNEAFEK